MQEMTFKLTNLEKKTLQLGDTETKKLGEVERLHQLGGAVWKKAVREKRVKM